jgi:anaerobic selenocysteine-containing dehydrogenase
MSVPLREQVSPGRAAPISINGEFDFRLKAIPSIFGNNLFSSQSPELAELRRGLQVFLNSDDFERMGLGERETVQVRTPFGTARAEAGFDTAIPRGMIHLRHFSHESGLSLIPSCSNVVPAAIEKAEL